MDPSELPPPEDSQDDKQDQDSQGSSKSAPRPSARQIKNLATGGNPISAINPAEIGQALETGEQGVMAALKLARAAPILLNPTVLVCILLLLIFLALLMWNQNSEDPATSTAGEGSITITTGNTKVENVGVGDASKETSADQEIQGVQTYSGKAVLGIFDGAIDFLKKTAEELADLAKQHKDSLVTYTITASYTGAARDIEVVYPIPENAMFISASGTYSTTKGKDATTGVEKITELRWLFSKNDGSVQVSTAPSATTTQGVSFTKYTQGPYFLPSPNGASDTNYDQTTITALNTLGNAVSQNSTYLKSKFAPEYVDPFLSVIWVGAIEGIGNRPYFWNCKDISSITINDGCPGGYTSGRWQVGYGIQVAQVGGHLASDFDSIYGAGSSNNANKVREVGQAVISGSGGKITNPSTFPSVTIPALVSSANSGNQSSQHALAILLLDQKLGATAIALEVAGDISSRGNWRQTMIGWGSYYGENMQAFSNRAKALADKYSGIGGGSGGAFGSKSFTVTVLPLVKDEPLDSGVATMNVDEIAGSSASGSGSTSTTTSGGYVAPSTDTCGKYSLTSNPGGKNYGDPTCGYDKNKLYDMLKQLDPQNADLWFNKIIPCESAYDPNTYYRSGSEGDTPDPYGAWGLFQMGRGVDGPFTDITKGSTNAPTRPEDRGDVNWEKQVSNAVNFNKKHLAPFGQVLGAYWACAR